MRSVLRGRLWLWLVLGLSLALSLAPLAPTLAQTAGTPTEASLDYDAWEAEATRAESLVEAGRASTAFLENLRTTLVGWRAQFLAAQNANAARIETIQAQIDALGPAPADGESEPDAIAERRLELNQRLAEAQLPRVNATEAFNRANGLIAEIDALVSERQAQELLELDPTPLNPLNWTTTLRALRDVSQEIYGDTTAALGQEARRQEAVDNLGQVAILGALGLLLLLRGRAFVLHWGARWMQRQARAGRASLGYLMSLGQVALPVLGVFLLGIAVVRTGMASNELTQLLAGAVGFVLSVFVGLWLAGRLLPLDADHLAVFDIPVDDRLGTRRTIRWLGLFIGLGILGFAIADLDLVPPAARGVLLLPIYVAMAFGYWRLGKTVLALRAAVPEDESPGFALRLGGFVARALLIVAVAGPILGAIGYLNAAELLMIPTGLSLAVMGFILSLQPVIRDLYALSFRTDEAQASEALTPVLINFVLAFAAMPVLALIWGVRPERLGELYSQFLEGFTLGDTRITPLTLLAVVLVFAGGLLATRLLQGALRSTVLPRTKMDVGARNAVTSGIGYIGIALAGIIAVTSAGIDLTALGFVVGALSVGIGFGLQNVVSNFVSGIILLIERPISEGDWIEVNGNMGIVKDISVRSTRIETFDKTDVIVPNADFISGTVTNWTRGNNIGRAVLTVGVAYGNDTRRVQEILLEIARNHPVVATFPEPGVDFLGFGADSLDFRIRAILRDVNQMVSVKTELNHQIAERFAEEGIEIPFAQRDIWLRNPEALSAGAGPKDKDAEA